MQICGFEQKSGTQIRAAPEVQSKEHAEGESNVHSILINQPLNHITHVDFATIPGILTIQPHAIANGIYNSLSTATIHGVPCFTTTT
jgi:hypothetical protein